MSKSSPTILAVLVAALMSLAMWTWIQKVAIPHQQSESAAQRIPRGNLSDLYPRWLGARELLIHRRDPYRDDITREIQTGYYGRVLDRSQPNDPKDEQAFAYPVYVAFLLAPTVEMPFVAAQRIFSYLLVVLTAASVVLWMRAFEWRVSGAVLAVWILLTLSCFPAIQGLKLQQLSLLVAALIAAFAFALSRRYFVWAGVFLALATIKPQLVALTIVWLCIWVVGDWRNRQRVLWSFAVAMALLVIGGEVLLPGWIHEFRGAMTAYYQYTGGGKSVLDAALTPIWGRAVSALLVGLLALLTWRVHRAPENAAEFQWSLSLVLAITLAVIPMFAPYNQLLLLPALMVIARSVRDLWAKNRLVRLMVVITALSVFFQWIASAGLSIAWIFLPGPTVQKAWGLPIYASFAIPITILALLLVARGVLQPDESTSAASI